MNRNAGGALASAIRWLERLLTVELGLLTATGVWLFFFYRPSRPIIGEQARSAQVLTIVHRVVAVVSVPTVLTIVILVAVMAATDRARPVRAAEFVAPIVAFVGALVALATGFLLPWDQLALQAVTVGTDLSGFRFLFGSPDVRFVLMDGREVDTATVARAFVIHVVAAIVIVGAMVISARPGMAGPRLERTSDDGVGATPVVDRNDPGRSPEGL